MVKVAIIIPVHNRQQYTQAILSQIHQQLPQLESPDLMKTIVVDDGSTDGTSEMVQQQYPQVHLLKGDGSLWWTGAIVKGMEYAIATLNADYIVWLNDDIALAENFLINLSNLCHSNQYKEAVVGGIIRDKTYPNWVVYSGTKQGQPLRDINCFSPTSELEVNLLSGNIVVIPRAVITKVGYPNATLFPHHGGDFEYIKLVKQNQFKIISTSQLQAFTNYESNDLIRYMPYWMQWYLKRSWSDRWKIIQGLKTLKSNQNIWLFVNIRNRDCKSIPFWKYYLCYADKLLKLLLVNFIPRNSIEQKISQYLKSWNVPSEITEAVLNSRDS
jgi:glycosyltransferase involved in cell wall biosynthesis